MPGSRPHDPTHGPPAPPGMALPGSPFPSQGWSIPNTDTPPAAPAGCWGLTGGAAGEVAGEAGGADGDDDAPSPVGSREGMG